MKYIILSILILSLFLIGCTATTTLTCEQQGYIKAANIPACSCEPSVQQPQSDPSLFVYIIDVGQGDAQLIQYGDKEMLIDCGDNTKGSTVVQFLKNKGVTTLDYLMITHPDSDHLGGCDDVINQIPTTVVITNGQSASTVSYNDVEKAITARGSQKMIANPGDSWQIGLASMKVIQSNNGFPDTNENSIVSKLTFNDVSVLFTGDCEKSCETLLWNKDIESTALKVGHHGSKYATSTEFLQKVKPKVAFISVGAGNSYGHPAPETLLRLSQENILKYRTDVYGTITFRTNGETYEVI